MKKAWLSIIVCFLFLPPLLYLGFREKRQPETQSEVGKYQIIPSVNGKKVDTVQPNQKVKFTLLFPRDSDAFEVRWKQQGGAALVSKVNPEQRVTGVSYECVAPGWQGQWTVYVLVASETGGYGTGSITLTVRNDKD